MNCMDTEGVIASIVETMLPRFSSPVLGLNMVIEIDASNPDTHKDARRQLHLLFIRPSNYTRVLTRVVDDNDGCRIGREIEYRLMSDHDSCWRSDGLSQVFQLLRECCAEVDPGAPFDRLSPRTGFYPFGGDPRYVEVYKVDHIPQRVTHFQLDGDERYGRELVKVKTERYLTVQEAVEFMPGGSKCMPL